MMAHRNDCIVVIKDSQGRSLRDVKGKGSERDVFLKHAEEYSIFLKNKSNRNMVASISIDDSDALGGEKIKVPANDFVVLERFAIDGDLHKGNKFKFVAVDSGDEGIVDPTSKDNGKIKVEFYKEKESYTIKLEPKPWYVPVPYYPPYPPYDPWVYRYTTTGDSFSGDSTLIGASLCDSGVKGLAASCNASPEKTFSASLGKTKCKRSIEPKITSNVGATTEGEESNQRFTKIAMDTESFPCATIVLRLKVHQSSITTKDKKNCPECNVKVGWNDKFCLECGETLSNYIEIKVCRRCDEEVSVSDKFCKGCGLSLGEIRLTR